jgi:uncharacterized repeat protein (TIGR01451 family)
MTALLMALLLVVMAATSRWSPARATSLLEPDKPGPSVVLQVSKQDSLLDEAEDGEANPGDRIRYRIVIRNLGSETLDSLVYQDVLDSFSVLVPGSINSTPIARDDSRIAPWDYPNNVYFGLLDNDSDPDGAGPPLAVTQYDATSAASATPNVVVNLDGSFTYDIPEGFVGMDSFGYTVSDGEGNTARATVTMEVVSWYWPKVLFPRIDTDRQDIAPCAHADPCTIPMYTDFRVSFHGTTSHESIRGITWSADLGLYQPYGTPSDTVFLQLPPPPARLDSVVVGMTTVGTVDTLWNVDGDTVTAHHYSSRQSPIPSGPFEYDVNVVDDQGLQRIPPEGHRVITVNYDPDTRLHSIPECDCPTPPEDCDPQKFVPVGWVTGIHETLFPSNEWRLFCPGDTLPNLAHVTFYATGWDDPRDEPIDEMGGLAETQYRFRYEFTGPTEAVSPISSRNMPFSNPAWMAADHPLPGGVPFRGGEISWTTCGFDYQFQAGAQDEQFRTDGTPAALDFMVNGSPVLDSLTVPAVFVFVPTCNGIWEQVGACPDPDSVRARFAGTDTIPIFGTWSGDASNPFDMGSNRFVFPFKAWAHDHPRDRNEPGTNWYGTDEEGRIRAWRYTFDCTEPECQDQVIPGEKAWRPETRDEGVDPPHQEVFDENLNVVIAVDTFCTETPCGPSVAKAYLKSSRFGHYEFTLQGRDTDPFGQGCWVPADLSQNPTLLQLDISEQGRRTAVMTRNTTWLRYREVRP